MPTYLTAENIAEEMQIARSSAYLYMQRAGAIRIGRHLRITRVAWEKWLAAETESQRREAPAGAAAHLRAARDRHRPLKAAPPMHVAKAAPPRKPREEWKPR